MSAIEPQGLPRRCTTAGGLAMVLAGWFPWFTAGAIATTPLAGRALIVSITGVAIVVASVLAHRAPTAWASVVAAGTIVGLALVALSTLAPPLELTASLGVGLGAVGSVLALSGVFAALVRRRSVLADDADDDDRPDDATHDDDVDDVRTPDTTGEPASITRQVIRWGGAVIALVVILLVAWPAPTPDIPSRPSPVDSYDEVVARFDGIVADEEASNVFEPCTSRLFTHGEPTDVAVVLFHGLTNCPRQFVEFGELLFDEGHNVLVLRAPDHGIATADGSRIGGVANVSDLSAEALRDYADESVDLARGLGDEVRVLGLSMGGVLAAWTAQERDDVARVVAVAPAMTIPRVPASLTQVFRNVFHKLPNVSLPSAGTKLDHAYAGETTKGLEATFGMGAHVADAGYGASPAAGDVVVVLNPDDDQVDPVHLSEFTNAWAAHGGPVSLHRLPAVGLPHDVIDVDNPDSDPDLVYPILIALLEGERP